MFSLKINVIKISKHNQSINILLSPASAYETQIRISYNAIIDIVLSYTAVSSDLQLSISVGVFGVGIFRNTNFCKDVILSCFFSKVSYTNLSYSNCRKIIM